MRSKLIQLTNVIINNMDECVTHEGLVLRTFDGLVGFDGNSNVMSPTGHCGLVAFNFCLMSSMSRTDWKKGK